MQTIYVNIKPTRMSGVMAFNFVNENPTLQTELRFETELANFIRSTKPETKSNSVAVLFVAAEIKSRFHYDHKANGYDYSKDDCVLAHWVVIKGEDLAKYMDGNITESHYIFEENSYGSTFYLDFVQQTSLTHAVATIVSMLEGHKAGEMARLKMEKLNAERLRSMLDY